MNETFLHILKAALWNEKPEEGALPNSPEEWEMIIHEARRQTVATLLFDWIQTLPEEKQPAKDAMHRLMALSIRTRQMHLRLRQTLKQLDEMLQGIGVHGVLLKGEGVATVYPQPDARACGDIDFYVGKEAYPRVCSFLRQQQLVDDHASETKKHLHFTMNGNVAIEIHRIAATTVRFWRRKAFEQWITSHLKPRELSLDGSTTALLPDVTFDAFFLFYHAYYHFLTGGIGIRQLCDWTLHLHRYADEIDRDELEEILELLGLKRIWAIFSTIAVDHLGLPAGQMPFYASRRESRDVLEIIFEDGNFGQYNQKNGKRPKGYYSGKFYSLRNHIRRCRRLLNVAGNDPVYGFFSMLSTRVTVALLHK